MPIHPTAIVDLKSEIDLTVEIGPYVVVDGPVRVGPRTRLLAHARLEGDTSLGADNVVHPGASLGGTPQDLGYRGAASSVHIGDRNVFREGVTVHRAATEGAATEIGSDVYVMANAHVGHDSHIADRVVLANGALIGGHCDVGERVFISGNCVVHQHVRVGRLALLRGLSRTSRDVPPFALMDDTHVVRGVNRVGLARAGFDAALIRTLTRVFRTLFRVRCNLTEAMAAVEAEHGDVAEVHELLAFMRASKRGVAMGPAAGGGERED
jgi:UDP-N-acetylglucosamine acyltransferase